MENISYNPFKKFDKEWALVTCGTKEKYNTMTIKWGTMGTIWGKPMIQIFIRPTRYTFEFLLSNDYFTVSFYDNKYKKELSLIGTKSGREIDKVKECNFIPKFLNNGITFEQAYETFVCKKCYYQKIDVQNVNDIDKKQEGDVGHYMFIGFVEEKC